VKRQIGVVPEGMALFGRLTGYEFLNFAGRMYGLDRETAAQRSADEIYQTDPKLSSLLDSVFIFRIQYRRRRRSNARCLARNHREAAQSPSRSLRTVSIGVIRGFF